MKSISPLALAAALLLGAGAVGVALAGGTPVANVHQKGRVFAPGTITVNAGEALNFVNDDDIPHNVMIRDPKGKIVSSPLQKPGDETALAFGAAGEYLVLCGVHPKMKMTVSVK